MTESELLELGGRIATDPTCRHMDIGDPPRPLTNLEMHAATLWLQSQVQQLIEKHGCCGGHISATGYCPETGRPCPMFQKAQRIERQVFHAQETTT